jgi:hypothetical protein
MSSRSPHAKAIDFVVRRDDLRDCAFVESTVPRESDLAPGQVLLAVDRFALTANNITYAVFGEAMAYWSFFPAAEGFGRVPVWGFADVVRSAHPGLAAGERVYGYLPMSTHLVVQAERVGDRSFVDATAHRQALPALYNHYTRVANDPHYRQSREAEQMLFLPLFMTAFMLDDFFEENTHFGARAVVIASASSKTAIGLAFLLARNASCDLIGLTSSANVPFVKGLGCYDRVLPYDGIETLAAGVPIAFVDMSGNGSVIGALHRHFRDAMKHSCVVGATHWERRGGEEELPGPPPTLFFAPAQIEKRAQEWGPGGLEERFAAAWGPFVESVAKWMTVVEHRGPDAVRRAYLDTLGGRARPDEGHILSLFE